MSGSADYLRLGDWNARCDLCGAKRKGSELRQTWQGNWRCPEHWEPRQPQDFVRSLPENPTPSFVRNPPDVLIETSELILVEDLDETDFILSETGIPLATES